MRIRCFQHVAFENPGGIAYWADKHGHELEITRLFAGDELPAHESWDWLVLLGGPMSVHDEAEYPWMQAEKRYIAEAIPSGKPVIGICLGSQFIAEALGAKVYVNEQKEIGWFPLKWLHSHGAYPQDDLFKAFPEAPTVFHWHGETYDLPEGARRLASSAACLNQAFVYGEAVFGFQFHLEMMENNIKLIAENCGHELVDAPYIQMADRLLNASAEREQALVLLESFLNGLETEKSR
ncbi:hypothetical protein BBD42_12520 [Paenibacillus sp. BIHB 4019]|uniref:Glutamine amidotransferase domain-containing protein n=1 Tax=Paenibacillus sp. BIHB 4019 TaxID=1870819 RepID=A0A1B2DHN0_9BACL|nr:type 1 glutamine amidotransferase [Paenibacillus sp. BIHB 4019]ANY67196.1 hypothetical protein BBD42_12520 [Paenibacillus sp. BIHB 4019]